MDRRLPEARQGRLARTLNGQRQHRGFDTWNRELLYIRMQLWGLEGSIIIPTPYRTLGTNGLQVHTSNLLHIVPKGCLWVLHALIYVHCQKLVLAPKC